MFETCKYPWPVQSANDSTVFAASYHELQVLVVQDVEAQITHFPPRHSLDHHGY